MLYNYVADPLDISDVVGHKIGVLTVKATPQHATHHGTCQLTAGVRRSQSSCLLAHHTACCHTYIPTYLREISSPSCTREPWRRLRKWPMITAKWTWYDDVILHSDDAMLIICNEAIFILCRLQV